MDREDAVTAITLNDIILQKLKGIVNKIDIVSESDDDRTLQQEVQVMIIEHEEIAETLKERVGNL